MRSNYRIHLTRWAVTAPAEKHRSSNHHLRLPGPRRPQPAGDANVGHIFADGGIHKTSITAILTLIVLAVLGGCSTSDPASPGPSAPALMPLAVGNRWDYRMLTILEGDTLGDDIAYREVRGTTVQNGATYYTFNDELVLGLRGDSVSVARYDSDRDSLIDFEVLLRYPVSLPQYHYDTRIPPDFPGFDVRVSQDSVDTSIGRLSRINYDVGSGLQVQFGFSPGIGLVTMENRFGTKWVLHSYHLVEGS
jgi:hypothetical protein